MKKTLTNICRSISEHISNIFRNSPNGRPAIIKDKLGFKLNFGFFQCEWSREWKYSLSGENNTSSGDAGSKPALHSFYSYLSFGSYFSCFNQSRMYHNGDICFHMENR